MGSSTALAEKQEPGSTWAPHGLADLRRVVARTNRAPEIAPRLALEAVALQLREILTPAMSQENVEVAWRALSAWNDGGIDALVGYLDSEVE